MKLINTYNYIMICNLGISIMAIAALGVSCVFDTKTNLCDASGRRCGPGMTCAAHQDVCIDIGGCGDGIIEAEAGEVCDDGNILEGDGCSADCKSNETCGNGIVDAGETCDDGNTVNGDGCSSNCGLESCGDRIVEPGEECDTGPSDTPGCNRNCTFARCGDGYVNLASGEDCDEGAGFDTPRCNRDCTFARCGDGYINAVAGEVCDPGEPGRPPVGCPAPSVCKNCSGCM